MPLSQKIISYSLLFVLCCNAHLKAQNNPQDSSLKVNLVLISAVGQLPAADFAKRFGLGSNLRLEFHRLLPNNLMWGVSAGALVGNQVRETDIASNLTTAQGEIIDENGNFAVLELQERGITAMAHIAKIYVLKGISPNQNSGLVVQGGIGFVQHKINIYSSGGYVPQLSGAYKKGYDRLTNGVALQQSIGYQNLSNNRRKNFYAGIDLIESLTKNRRSYNFNTQTADNKLRLDIMIGLKIGFILPLYKKFADEYISY